MTNTIISLEGNIGSGKSTILQIMQQKYKDMNTAYGKT